MRDIILNVYDLPGQTQRNNALYPMGLGFYHSGVEYNRYEYSFSSEGICRTRPVLPEFGSLRESVNIGTYSGSDADFAAIIYELGAGRFAPGTYDVVRCNCNHFSEALCLALLGQGIPRWVNRAADAGSSVIGSSSSKPGGATSTKSSLPAPGVVKEPSLNMSASTSESSAASVPPPPPTGGIFSWLFGGSGSRKDERVPTESSTLGTSAPSQSVARTGSNKKKELTPKQKELLAKLKSSK